MRALVAIQARLGSSRFPKKILSDIDGEPMLAVMHRRLQACKEAFAVVVACPTVDVKEIEKTCPGIPVYGGPEEDLLTRLLGCALEYEAFALVRVTGDCPLIVPDMIDYGIQVLGKNTLKKIPCVQNWRPRTYPDGWDFDIWTVDFLERLHKDGFPKEFREYFALHLINSRLPNSSIVNDIDFSNYRLTVDYPEDLELVRKIFWAMNGECWGSNQIIQWLKDHPEAVKLNAHRIDGKHGEKP